MQDKTYSQQSSEEPSWTVETVKHWRGLSSESDQKRDGTDEMEVRIAHNVQSYKKMNVFL